jgi:hypothetical protein
MNRRSLEQEPAAKPEPTHADETKPEGKTSKLVRNVIVVVFMVALIAFFIFAIINQ